MDKDLNFDEALAKLEAIVGEIQAGNIRISDLKAKIAEAKEYAAICQKELDSIRKDLDISVSE